jgi:hypothetical protein
VSTEVPPTDEASTTTSTTEADVPVTVLPHTGRGVDGFPARLATMFLVGGIGLVGVIRRSPRADRSATP